LDDIELQLVAINNNILRYKNIDNDLLMLHRRLSWTWRRELNDGLQRVDRMFQSYTRSDVIIFRWWSWGAQRGLHRQRREITSLSRKRLRIGFNRAFARLRRA